MENGIEHLKSFPDGRIPWKEFEHEFKTQELKLRNRQEVALQEPEDNWMYYQSYVENYGDPTTNGKGHTRAIMYGKVLVIILGGGFGEIIRSNVVQADLEGVVANSSANFTGEESTAEMAKMQQALLSGLMSTPSSGTPLGTLLGKTYRNAHANEASAAAASTPSSGGLNSSRRNSASGSATDSWITGLLGGESIAGQARSESVDKQSPLPASPLPSHQIEHATPPSTAKKIKTTPLQHPI